MSPKTRAAFKAHVRKLTALATDCSDEDRRLDAVRSLSAMALLIHDPGLTRPVDQAAT